MFSAPAEPPLSGVTLKHIASVLRTVLFVGYKQAFKCQGRKIGLHKVVTEFKRLFDGSVDCWR